MFRHSAILLLSTILGTLAWSTIDAPREPNFWPVIKPARWKIEQLVRKELGIPSGYGQYGRDDSGRYSEENENDADDDAFMENCYDSKPRFVSGKSMSGITPRIARPSAMVRSARDPRRDPRKDPRLPRSVWIPVSMSDSYPKDSKYQWDLKKDFGLDEGYVRAASDSLLLREPSVNNNVQDFAIDQAELQPSEIETKLPWSEKTRDEQLFDPLDLNRPSPGKSHNENININSNSNMGRRFYGRQPILRRRSLRY